MSQINTPHELYIEQVKSDEKKKKRKYLLLLLLLLFLGSAGVWGLFSLIRSPEGLEYRTFNKTELDLEMVKGILADKGVRIRVLDYERGRLDTINSVEEYKAIYGDSSGNKYTDTENPDDNAGDGEGNPEDNGADEGIGDGFDGSNGPSRNPFADNKGNGDESTRKGTFAENSGPLRNYKIDIIGKRVAGEILSFIITDYNPSIRYNLDFGNGVLQDAKEITLYMYPSSGRFTLNLTATDPQFNRSNTKEYLEIKEKVPSQVAEDKQENNNKPITSDWVIVDNTKPDDNTGDNGNNGLDQIPDGSETPDNTGDNLNNNNSASSGSSDEVEQPRSTTPTEQVDTKTTNDFDASKIKVPLTTAQKAPSFPGGTKSMYSFLNQHIAYPQQARDYEVEGKVYVQFEVDRGGIIKTPKVVKGLGYGCDEEALRIVKLMPRWEPARHMNQVVPFLYTLPVTFRLID